MFVKQLSTVVLAGSLLLTGCARQTAAPQPNLSQEPQLVAAAAERPNLREGAASLPQPAVQINHEGRLQRPPITPPANLEQLSPIPAYDAEQMLTAFAQEHLGIQPTVVRAQGARGDIALPPSVNQQVNGNVALAGQVSAGVITVGNYRGAAQVAVGSGSISGDLQADISSASLGAYSLLMPGVATPTDASAALNLIISTYPGLVGIDLQPETEGQGYIFRAVTTTPGIDLQTQQATAVTQAIVAGVSGQGRAAMVWVVVGNGTFAVAL